MLICPTLPRRRRLPLVAGILALSCALALFAAVCQVRFALKEGTSRHLALIKAHANAAEGLMTRLRALPASACDTAPEVVNRLAAFSPDVRSVGRVINGTVTCSSVFGTRPVNFINAYGIPVPAGDISLRTTPVLPGRPVIVFVQHTTPGQAVFVVMNAQPLLPGKDDRQRLHYTLRAGTGDKLESGPSGAAPPGFTLRALLGQVMFTVRVPLSAVLRQAAQNLPATLPLAMLAVALMRRRSGPPRLKAALLSGMRRGEFATHYQPVCETDSGRCGGAAGPKR